MKTILTTLILTLFVTLTSFSQTTFTVDGLNYEVTSTTPNEVTLTGGTPATSSLDIPETVSDGVESFTVVAIANSAFESAGLTSVDFPSTLRDIGNRAFKGNTIASLLLPNNLITVGGAAFQANNIGGNLIIPNSVTSIGNQSFEVNQITSLVISENVSNIGNNTFRANLLSSVTIPAGIISIGDSTFRDNPLTAIEALGTVPATIFSDSFSTRSTIDLTIPDGTEAAYETAGWIGFKSVNGIVDFVVGDTFTENTFDYEIISLMPNEVAITGGTAVPLALVIDGSISSGGLNFSVVAVGGGAFTSLGLTDVTFPNTIRTIGGDAFSGNALEVVVIPEGVTDIPGGCFRDNNITSVNLPQSLLTLGSRSFENNQLAVLTLPINVSAIAQNAFKNNPITTIASLNPNAPSVVLGTGDDSFTNEGNIDLTVPDGTEIAYETAGWIGFGSLNGLVIGDTFTVNNFNYTILSVFPSTVAITGGISIPQDLVIAGNVSNEGVDFTVTRVGDAAFDNEGLTSLSLPNSLITIGNQAFRINSIGGELVIPNSVTSIGNQVFEVNQITSVVISENIPNLGNNTFRNNLLTSITIPAGVTTLGDDTFSENPLTAVISLGSTPPSIVTGSTNDSFFLLRDAIDLFVPIGTSSDYINAGWTGFKSITETTFDIVIAPKVFLQGASLNPITGEEALMRDDLRANNLIPLSSPYGDGATVDPTVFNTTGADAILDWVLVELREGADNENTTVVAIKSALLQRDGDIVGLDGTSPITFTADEGSYFIAIRHRNHIGVMMAVPAALSSVTSTLDFTQDAAFAKGENLALTTLVNGAFAMIAGDADGSSQILNTDINEGLSQAGGGQAYSTADADMNGFVLNTDVQLLILVNSGTVQQFD